MKTENISKDRISEIMSAASVSKVDTILIKEWELLELCVLSLRAKDQGIPNPEKEYYSMTPENVSPYSTLVEKSEYDAMGALLLAVLHQHVNGRRVIDGIPAELAEQARAALKASE